MSEASSAERIERLANEWLARCDRSDWDAAAQRELDAWLAEDPRHRGAFTRAAAAWSFMDRARALAGGRSVEDIRQAGRRRSIQRWGIGIAATVVFGVAMSVMFASPTQRFDTRLGEIREITLADGSAADLNTQSRLEVSIEPGLRTVELTRGEAWFRVAKDPSRPFTVQVGNVRVRAIGTAFAVRKKDEGVDVLVTEGVVSAWVVGDESKALRMPAGSRAFLGHAVAAAHVVEEPAAIERELAWRKGEIGLESETLAVAAAEFNRYNETKIVIEDATLGSRRLVGRFRINEPEAFARAVASTLDAEVEVHRESIHLKRGAP